MVQHTNPPECRSGGPKIYRLKKPKLPHSKLKTYSCPTAAPRQDMRTNQHVPCRLKTYSCPTAAPCVQIQTYNMSMQCSSYNNKTPGRPNKIGQSKTKSAVEPYVHPGNLVNRVNFTARNNNTDLTTGKTCGYTNMLHGERTNQLVHPCGAHCCNAIDPPAGKINCFVV